MTFRRTVVALLTVSALAVAGAAAVASQPASANPSSTGLPAPPDRPTPHSRLDGHLVELAEAALDPGPGPFLDGRHPATILVSIEVFPVDGLTDQVAEALVALGGTDVATIDGLVTAKVPAWALFSLGTDSRINWARPALQPVSEAILGEGVAFIEADRWQAAGFTGAGVKVAIIDVGFGGYSALLGSELPSSVVTRSFCPKNGFAPSHQSHGTAVAEIVHEVAPQALLYLICVEDLFGLAQAVDYAVGEGVDVINHSVGWFNAGRGDGSGALAPIVATANSADVLWVNSAGNYARTHWSGSFSDTSSSGFHNFTSGDETNRFTLDPGQQAFVFLRWDDWPTSSNDYDLYLFRDGTTPPVASSANFQTGSQPPTEGLTYRNSSSSTQTLHAAIFKFDAAAAPTMDLFVVGVSGDIQHRVEARSLNDPATSSLVTAVGAVRWDQGTIESFSSRGPTIDGRIKPDLVGPDRVSGATFGTSGFFGTSAAAPHIAGAAALLIEARPGIAVEDLHSALIGLAEGVGSPVPNNTYGAGILRLGEAGGLVADPSFESGSVAASPHVFVNSGGAWSIVDWTPRSGTWHARYKSVSQTGTAFIQAGESPMAVSPGAIVSFSAWVKSDSGRLNRFRPRAFFFNASGQLLTAPSGASLTPTTSYQQIAVTATAPSGAASVVFRVQLFAEGFDGNYWVDDLDGEILGGPEPESVPNSVLDPGFESGSVAASPHLFVNSGGAWSIVDWTPRSGSWHARYRSVSQTGTAFIQANGPSTTPEAHLAVSAGNTVSFSAWVKSDSGRLNRFRPRALFYNSSGTLLSTATGAALTPSTSYQQIAVTATAPTGAAFAVFQIQLFAEGFDGNYWVDDLHAVVGSFASATAIADPGFESGSVAASPHVFVNSGGAWSIVDWTPRSGTWHARYKSAGQTGTALIQANGPSTTPAAHLAVSAGNTVSFSAWVKSDSGRLNRFRPRALFYNSSGTLLSIATGATLTPTTSYQQIAVTATAPTGTAFAVFQIQLFAEGFDGNYWVDDLGAVVG